MDASRAAGCGRGRFHVSSYLEMRNRLLALGAALAAFGLSLGSGFHFDDYGIFRDPVLTTFSGLTRIWTRTSPLTEFTFWLNYQLGGQDPLGYHLLNLALHLGAVLLAYECLRRLMPEGAAAAAAAIFAVHPLQAEAVNYVWARGMMLGAVFCLASLLAWLKDRRWLAVGLFLGGVLAREEYAVFAGVILLSRTWPRTEGRSTGANAARAAMVAVGVAALVRLALSNGIGLGGFLLAQGLVLLRYLRLFVWPFGFTVDPDVRVPAVWLGALGWAAVVAALAGLWKLRGREWARWLAGGILLLLPFASIFPAPDLAADRRAYLAMFAFSAAAGLLLAKVPTPALAAGAAVVLIMLSLVRTFVWFSDETLWREAVRRAPEKARPKVQLSRVVKAREALELLDRASTLAPYDASVAAEKGMVLLQEKQFEPAILEFGRAIALEPKNARHYNNRGVAFAQLGEFGFAAGDFEQAMELDGQFTEARENLRKLLPAQ